MKLSGDRNQCQGCKEYFNSSFAFDKHRTGEFGKDRRCLSTDEMLAKGMGKTSSDFWASTLMPKSILDLVVNGNQPTSAEAG